MRAKPRIRFLDKNLHNVAEGLSKTLPITPGVTILSGQLCSIDAASKLLVLGWVAGNSGPFLAVNDSTDEATRGTGMGTATNPYRLTVIELTEPRTVQIGYYKVADTYLPGDMLTPDGVTGGVKKLTNSATEVQVGYCSLSAIQAAAVDTSTLILGAPPGPATYGYENVPVGAVSTNIPAVTPVLDIQAEVSNITPGALGVVNVITFVTQLRKTV